MSIVLNYLDRNNIVGILKLLFDITTQRIYFSRVSRCLQACPQFSETKYRFLRFSLRVGFGVQFSPSRYTRFSYNHLLSVKNLLVGVRMSLLVMKFSPWIYGSKSIRSFLLKKSSFKFNYINSDRKDLKYMRD